MHRLPGRLWMRLISHQTLGSYMDFRGETNRSLADKCGPTVRRAIIGHLRTGFRTSCSTTTAREIERVLNAPPGSLFVPTVATGLVGSARSKGRAA